ncbi:hypothetical protein B296_00053060 [Ensete ventricosum]|uniref:Uncharacterized protein n=1 Tax=Ensete ventricosum TaxID=4639 RepID=A0A426XX74_ENSVE|nr:hypothetical protein B296_00053060 [Ensete ventricosum]
MTRVRTWHRDESPHDNGGGGARKARIGVYACAHRGVFHRRLDAKAVASPREFDNNRATRTQRRQPSSLRHREAEARGKETAAGGGGSFHQHINSVTSTTTGRRERSGVSCHLCVTGSRGKRERDGGGGWRCGEAFTNISTRSVKLFRS